MKHRKQWIFGLGLLPVAVAALAGLRSGAERIENPAEAGRRAATYPDYSGVAMPPNIAPLNFKILESGRKFCLRISGDGGPALEIFSGGARLAIPLEPWHKLLEANRGGELRFDLFAKGDSGWMHFETVRNRVAAEPVDPYVEYRYIPPIYDRWDEISIRQRDLRSFDERVILDTKRSKDEKGNGIEGTCVNCHTFLNHGTAQMLVHTRPGRPGESPAMLLVQNGTARKLDTRDGNAPAAYISWHPSGKLLVFSRNSLMQMFHTAGMETREVVDRDSDLSAYRVDTNELVTVPQIARPDRWETFPAWSQDGRYLYFSSAQRLADKNHVPLQYDKIQYDLVRISYDEGSNRWGELETVVSSEQLGKSISLAQVSPDGRLVMFCGHDYGSFPIFQPSSDLYVVDVGGSAFAVRRLDEINSNRTDSYHTWSSNGKWAIFSSKREDGMFARFYLTHLEPDGRFSKPLLMPQEDPDFYGRCLMTFNRPELVREPVQVTEQELTRAIRSTATRPANASSGKAAPPAAVWR